MNQNIELYNNLKQKSWDLKLQVDGRNHGPAWLSTSEIVSSVAAAFDAVKVATKCAEKATPGTKYYGMTVEEIIDSWNAKASQAAYRGMGLDTYIQATLHNKPRPIVDDDDNLQKKCHHFDEFFNEKLSKLPNIELVGTELWINSLQHTIRGRMDALFSLGEFLLLFDWKNNDEFKVNNFEKMQGPCDFLPQTDMNKFTIQLYTYKYILEQEFEQKVKSCRVVQFNDVGYHIHKPQFEYQKEFMEEVFAWARKYHNK